MSIERGKPLNPGYSIKVYRERGEWFGHAYFTGKERKQFTPIGRLYRSPSLATVCDLCSDTIELHLHTSPETDEEPK